LVLGPGIAPPAHLWAIDGTKAGIKQGTICAVHLKWDEETRLKKIWWGPCDEEWALDLVATSSTQHGYSIAGSWNMDKPVPLVKSKVTPGLFEGTFHIGQQAFEHFFFMRDGDPLQAIYPSGQAVLKPGVSVCGPDHLGDSKSWRVIGSLGAKIYVQLQVSEGSYTVTTKSEASGVLTWSSEDGPRSGNYYVTASWNKWGFSPMVPDPSNPSIYRLKANVTRERLESFQIVLDRDKRQALHPEMNMADSGQSPVCGPDGKGQHLHFGIFGEAGSEFEITLDLSQEEKQNIVTWTDAGSGGVLKDLA
jgi:hypothetical protein